MAKRLLVAYGLWALGGPLGLHHIYLGRDSHALLWMLTLGGFGAGWLWDFWHIPGWVATANGVGVAGDRGGTVPALSPLRLAGQVTVGTYFGLVAALGLPWVPVLLAQPLAVGLGVQLVSSVGDQTAEAPSVLAAAFLASFLFQGWVLAVLPVSLAASVAAQRHRRYKPRGTPLPRLPARLYHLGLACLAFAAPLACRGLCGAAGVLGTLLALPRAATELLLLPLHAIRLLAETLGLAGDPPPQPPTTGFGARSWSQRQQWAYEVLGLPAGASAEDVHRSYRELVKVWHPDHNRQRAEEAQRRFIELQEAYEELGGPRRAAGG
ncbi:dnaJ homolog subfamily C member 22 isoform X1 [Rissa tridactyla]|uniref:dnaJ homolog subfamily C member 22 isoform X1 n=1 Tax=Rissa tridactyla TaxID=75485 RepID=UPI0023BB0A17|nr:dnaJ homolog subfamily C member 22 isoform X1 [Rissa tridactyla]